MILCCGEALIDMVPATSQEGQVTYAPLSGGAVFNTAIALGRLKTPIQFFSGLSRDLFGEQLASELKASNVNCDLLVRSDRPTTLAFVKLTNGHAQYTFYDENTAGRMIAPIDVPERLENITAAYFGGISLCTEPAAQAYEEMANRLHNSATIMLDPNIRANFITDEDAYRARLSRLITMSDVVKVSDEDLDWLFPELETPESKIEHVQCLGAKIVIVTRGSAGASAYRHGQVPLHVEVPKVAVVDTVGAGDTFNAGFLSQLENAGCLKKRDIGNLSENDLENAMVFASKVAAVTVSRAGANPPYLNEVPRDL